MSAFSHIQHTLKRFFNSCIWSCHIDITLVLLEIRKDDVGVVKFTPEKNNYYQKAQPYRVNIFSHNYL